MFVLNAISYLGGNREVARTATAHPGQPITLRPATQAETLSIEPPGPGAKPVNVARDRRSEFHFTGTNKVGLYRVRADGQDVADFAVNLFDPRESDVTVAADRKLKIGHDEISTGTGWEETRRDAWKFVLLGALAILLFEWYIYNRRAYL